MLADNVALWIDVNFWVCAKQFSAKSTGLEDYGGSELDRSASFCCRWHLVCLDVFLLFLQSVFRDSGATLDFIRPFRSGKDGRAQRPMPHTHSLSNFLECIHSSFFAAFFWAIFSLECDPKESS